MPTKVTPGSGALFTPVFDSNYGVESIIVENGGTGYASTDPPKIEIKNTKPPQVEGVFYPVIINGSIKRIAVIDPGVGYFPIKYTLGEKIGIKTTSEVESSIIVRNGTGEDAYLSVASTESHIIMDVIGGEGTSMFENGYNVAISTSIVGTSASITPNFSGNLNRFYGNFSPYIPSNTVTGLGTGAKFSVFIVYNSSTGYPISTSIILREGGNGYEKGNTVSISGTFLNGSSPANDLTFNVSSVSNTRIVSAANSSFLNLPSYNISGTGTDAKFNVYRNSLGDISLISVSNGGVGYALSDKIGISGTYIGGIAPQDDLKLSPKTLGTNKLPESLYVIKLDENNFKVSGLSTSLELDLVSYGVGNHNFESENSLQSTIISIDNIIQSPLYKRDMVFSLQSLAGVTTDRIYVNEDISELSGLDILEINSELMRIKYFNVNATNELIVERGILGSTINYHEPGSQIKILRGDYNISKDNIYFTTSPYGPKGPEDNKVSSTFQGRIFSRQFDSQQVNDKNLIFDDISDQFVGSSSTEFYLKSNLTDVVGIYTDTNSVLVSGVDVNNNPLIFINNIPQISNTDFVIDSNQGKNRIKFLTGSPSAGKISRVGINTGYGYQPLVSAGATVVVGTGGTIKSIKLLGSGSGYRSVPKIKLLSNVGSGASFSATIGAGGTVTSITIVNPGSGYTSSPNPIVSIGIPSSYSYLPLVYKSGYSGNGSGAKASVVIGNQGNTIGFELNDPGQYYSVGDVLTVSGVTTNPKVGAGFTEFLITVEETMNDKFNGFYPGQFIQFDDISKFFTGTKKKFILTVTQGNKTDILNLKSNPEIGLNIENNLFIFINDILQEPITAYTFNGSRLLFKEPPKPNSKCTILFYRGSDLDVETIDPPKTIKEGDTVQIGENILDPLDREQFERVVKKIISTDTLDTFTYDSIGINTDPLKERPLSYKRQTEDRIINGSLISKSRPNLKSRLIPNTNIIKKVTKTDSVIYVNNVFPLFSIDNLSEDLKNIVIVENIDISPALSTAIVSSSSTISGLSLLSGGSGYLNLTSPEVSISFSAIGKKDPIYNWKNSTVGVGQSVNLNSIIYSNPMVAVGNSSRVLTSTNGGLYWYNNSIGYGNTITLNSISVGNTNNFVACGNSGRIFSSIGMGGELSSWNELKKLKEDVVVGVPEPIISFSSYTGDLNAVKYISGLDSWVIVGNSQRIFTGVGIGTTVFYERTPSTFANFKSIATNDSIVVVVGTSANIVYSSDLIIWSKVKGLSSTKNFYDIIWSNNKFILVGESGTVFTSSNGIVWEKIVTNITIDLVKIRYNDGIYFALSSTGDLYFSFDLNTWDIRKTNQQNKINDISFIPKITENPILSDEGRTILIGDNGTVLYSEPEYNRASGIASVSSGVVTSITLTNPGFGYNLEKPPSVLIESDSIKTEEIRSVKIKGDFGVITSISIGASTIDFTLKSETYDNNNLGIGYSSLNTYGVQYSNLEIGDYFIIYDSNSTIGHALTGITTSLGGLSNYPASKVGTAVSYLNGVYRAERVSPPSVSGIVTVGCNFTYGPGNIPIQVNIYNNVNGIHGKYTWGKIYDYQSRNRYSPEEFNVNVDNGLTGINTSAIIYRTRGV